MKKGKYAAGLAIAGLAAGLLAPVASADPNSNSNSSEKAFCKNGNYQFFGYSNQGQCVAAVEQGTFIPYGAA